MPSIPPKPDPPGKRYCDTCNGSGFLVDRKGSKWETVRCPDCEGTGRE